MQLLKTSFSKAFTQGRIDRAKALLSQVPEGAALLKMAADNNVAIVFEPALVFAGGAGNTHNAIPDKNRPTVVQLSPFATTASLVRTLAHELRHVWQMRQLGNPQALTGMDFEQTVAFRRFVEGDAFVFENYIAAKLQRIIGVDMRVASDPDAGGINRLLGRDRRDETADPETAEGMRKLFDTFQQSHYARGYDDDVLALYNRAADWVTKGLSLEERDPALRGSLKKRFNVKSFKQVGDLARIAVIGGTRYLDIQDSDRTLGNIWTHIRDKQLQAARHRFTPEGAEP